MASEEGDIQSWRQKMPAACEPKIYWKGGKTSLMALTALVFVLVAFLIPQRYVELHAGQLDVSYEIDQLSSQIEVLAEEEIITQIEATEWKEKLADIEKEASGTDPAKTWESLDHLSEKIAQDAQEAAQKMLSETEETSRAQTLAEAMAEAGDQFDPATMTAAMAEMAQMMKKAMAANHQLTEMLDAETMKKIAEALKNCQFSAEDLRKLAETLDLSKAQLKEGLGRLCDAKMIDPKLLKLCESLGQCDSKKLAEMLAKEGKGNCAGLKECLGMCSGQGCCAVDTNCWGVSRGRGDAPMTWKQASTEEGVSFQEQSLPQAAVADLEKSELVGVSTGDPTDEELSGQAGSGSLGSATAGGGSANTQVVLPKHRSAVKKYFEREK